MRDAEVAIAAARAGAEVVRARYGSALRAAYVSDGRFGDNVHFAAGIVLCQAAGCVVTGLRGQPLHSGIEGLVVAPDAGTHAALLGAIERQFGPLSRER